MSMKYFLLTILLLSACQRSEIISDDIYGEPQESMDTIPIEAVLSEPKTYFDQRIAVAGTIHEVCQMDGCWLMLRSKETGNGLRVHAEIIDNGDYSFTVPKDISGRYAIVFGLLINPNPDHEAHYQMDAPGESPLLSLTANGVRVLPEDTI